jgi:hypothetical protein
MKEEGKCVSKIIEPSNSLRFASKVSKPKSLFYPQILNQTCLFRLRQPSLRGSRTGSGEEVQSIIDFEDEECK